MINRNLIQLSMTNQILNWYHPLTIKKRRDLSPKWRYSIKSQWNQILDRLYQARGQLAKALLSLPNNAQLRLSSQKWLEMRVKQANQRSRQQSSPFKMCLNSIIKLFNKISWKLDQITGTLLVQTWETMLKCFKTNGTNS